MAITLGERLKELLDDMELTADAFAHKIGVSVSAAAKWIRENPPVKLFNILKMASFFQCSADFICGRTDHQGKFNPIAPTFPARFIALIEKSGETKAVIFKKLGLNRHALYDWQKGFVPLSVNLIAIADYFGVTVDYLIGIEEL